MGNLAAGYATGKCKEATIIPFSFIVCGIPLLYIPNGHSVVGAALACLLLGFGLATFVTCSNAILLSEAKKHSLDARQTQSRKFSFYNKGCFISIFFFSFIPRYYLIHLFYIAGIFFILMSFLSYKKLKSINISPSINIDNEAPIQLKKLLLMLSSIFCLGLTYGIQKTTVGVHLHETVQNYFLIGIFFVLDPLLISTFQEKITSLTSKYSIHKVIIFGCILLGVSTFSMGKSETFLELIGALLIFITGEMLVMANSTTLSAQYGGDKHTALGVGASQAAYTVGLMLGPTISGVFMHYIGTQSAWLFSSIICFISAAFISPLIFNLKVKQLHTLEKKVLQKEILS